jgi:hypothetical protein
MCKDGGKKVFLKYVFFTHIYVTIAFSITNNKRNPKISKPFGRTENIEFSSTEYLLLSQGVDVCVSHESSNRVQLFR